MIAAVKTPVFDWAALAPVIALTAGMVGAILLGLFPGALGRLLAVISGVAASVASIALAIGLWNEPTSSDVIAASLVMDRAALTGIVIAGVAALVGIAIVTRARGTEDAGYGETIGLLMAASVGIAILAAAADLITVFLGLELLSIPLYILCASHVDRSTSLESGLKYLILGSLGSAAALMGMALLYGATGSMQLTVIAETAGRGELAGLVVPGVALLVAGFAFKLSLAPMHQWTPDVYDGAPTGVTAFMSVATKAAALVVTARLLLLGLPDLVDYWQPLLFILAGASIVVGNVGALGQPSMKRMLGYSSIAQAGYLVSALAVGAVGNMLAFLTAYAAATLAVFVVIAARELERPDLGDDLSALDGLSKTNPVLGWIGTIGLMGLAGLPLTAGFFVKVAVAGSLITSSQTWLAVLMIVGSIISLAYYGLPIYRIWRAPAAEPVVAFDAAAEAAAEARANDPEAADVIPVRPVLAWELVATGVVLAAITFALGIYPQPLLDLANDAGQAFVLTGK